MLFDLLVVVLGAVNRLGTLDDFLSIELVGLVVTCVGLLLNHLVFVGGVFYDLLHAHHGYGLRGELILQLLLESRCQFAWRFLLHIVRRYLL